MTATEAMTFDQWLDSPISGTTRRAYYSDNQLTAARDAWEAATEPPGYVLVPIEPTDAILDVMRDCENGYLIHSKTGAWQAMLAAAIRSRSEK